MQRTRPAPEFANPSGAPSWHGAQGPRHLSPSLRYRGPAQTCQEGPRIVGAGSLDATACLTICAESEMACTSTALKRHSSAEMRKAKAAHWAPAHLLCFLAVRRLADMNVTMARHRRETATNSARDLESFVRSAMRAHCAAFRRQWSTGGWWYCNGGAAPPALFPEAGQYVPRSFKLGNRTTASRGRHAYYNAPRLSERPKESPLRLKPARLWPLRIV
jgi:hypothetical protein